MENSNIRKQAKSDIFKELHPIISFYIKKGAKPKALKKFYKNGKNFKGLLDDIKFKGVNLVKEDEYQNLVREVLTEILDDHINKEKDEKYNKKQMKHIKEFYSFDRINEDFGTIVMGVIMGWLLYKFLKGLLSHIYYKHTKQGRFMAGDPENRIAPYNKRVILTFLNELRSLKQIPVTELNDRYFIRLELDNDQYDLRLMKNEKILSIDINNRGIVKQRLTDNDYNDFLKLIKPE